MIGKKKISGQTIAIIILAVILLITVAFGAVYAFYSAKSNAITGKIVMANLNIDLISEKAGESGKSEIAISNGTNVVPGQELNNSPLKVVNRSNASDIYLIVVYEVNAIKMLYDKDGNVVKDLQGNIVYGDKVIDEKKKPVIDVGAEYLNDTDKITIAGSNPNWIDYLFVYTNPDSTVSKYRCLVSTKSYSKGNEEAQTIEVIGENELKLHRSMGDSYQQTSISFVFQAYAIGASDSIFGFTNQTTKEEKCYKIVSTIYESVEYKFLNVTVNS